MCTSCSSVIRPGDPHTECWIHLGRDHTCSKCEETGSFMGFPSFRHYLKACYSGEGFPSGSGGKGPSPEKSGSNSEMQQDARNTSVSQADKNGTGNAVSTIGKVFRSDLPIFKSWDSQTLVWLTYKTSKVWTRFGVHSFGVLLYTCQGWGQLL